MAQWETLTVGAVLGAGLTLLVQMVLQRTRHRQEIELERLKQQLKEESEARDVLRKRVTPVMDTAGYLATHLGGWAMNHHANEIRERLRELDAFPEQFAEYPEIQRAIWAFQNTTNWILYEHGTFLTEEERRARQVREDLALRGTLEEQESQLKAQWEKREHVRTVELPEHYQALLTVMKALIESNRLDVDKATNQPVTGWRRFLRRLHISHVSGRNIATNSSKTPAAELEQP